MKLGLPFPLLVVLSTTPFVTDNGGTAVTVSRKTVAAVPGNGNDVVEFILGIESVVGSIKDLVDIVQKQKKAHNFDESTGS